MSEDIKCFFSLFHTLFNSIQFKFICIALFTIYIYIIYISKQLYRKCITEKYMEKYI